jgi:hypothetical protein
MSEGSARPNQHPSFGLQAVPEPTTCDLTCDTERPV